jgi:hypothetical protein
MATFSATDLATKPLYMGGYGNAMRVYGTVTPTAGASADIYKPVRIPAGMTVTGLKVYNADLDTGGTAFAVKIGYTPVNSADGPTAVLDYFVTANTFLSATSLTEFKFAPIKFEYDVDVIMTVTTAATTFASGDVVVYVEGIATGRK